MSAKFTYADPAGGWTEDLGTAVVRLGAVEGYALNADLGGTAGSRLSFDDPSGTVGHSGDAIKGLQWLFVDEQAESTGNQRILAAVIFARDYTHALAEDDSLRVGVSRHIETELQHFNAVLAFDPISDSDGNRPAEPVGTRLAWILGSSYLSGYVATTTTYVALTTGEGPSMDANDYRPSSTPLNVIEDCALAVGYNAFLVWDDETTSLPLLWFDDAKTSTAYSSAYRLSNVESEIDSFPDGTVGGTKTYSFAKAKLHRDPTGIASKIVYPYRSGWLVKTNSATETAFTRRGLVAPSQTVKTSATATTNALRLLTDHSTEADTLTGEVELPAAHVNAIRSGHRVSVHERTAPGYTGFNWWRVISAVPRQTNLTDQTYVVALTLVPMVPSITCDDPGNVDLNNLHGTCTGYVSASSPQGPHTSINAPSSPANINDGDPLTYSGDAYSLVDPNLDGPYYIGWVSDLGAAYTVACHAYQVPIDGFSARRPDTLEYSTDNATWTTATYTLDYYLDGAYSYMRYTLSTSVVARYWRITTTFVSQHERAYGFGFWNGIHGYTWKIVGQ